MTKKRIMSMIFTSFILVACGTPAASNNYVIPQQINEPQIAEITPTFETQIERVNNCDGTNSTYNVSYKTIQTQKAAFEVTVGAGGLVTGTPIPSALEVQLEAKITAALAKDYGLTTEKDHDIKLDNPQGTYLEHTIEWKVTRVKGLFEVVYGDGVAQVVFDKIANVELYNRTSKPLSCNDNNVNVPPTSIPEGTTVIKAEDVIPYIKGEVDGVKNVIDWWQEIDAGGTDGVITSTTMANHQCFGLVWNTSEYGYRKLIVFQGQININLLEGGWHTTICIPNHITISAEDVGKIQADWLGKQYVDVNAEPWQVILK